MKLQLETVRNLLLYLEENLTVSKERGFEEIYLDQITRDTNIPVPELINTIYALGEADYIKFEPDYGSDGIASLCVSRIKYPGYKFLESVRPEKIWKKLLKASLKVGTSSLEAIVPAGIGQITAAVLRELAKSGKDELE